MRFFCNTNTAYDANSFQHNENNFKELLCPDLWSKWCLPLSSGGTQQQQHSHVAKPNIVTNTDRTTNTLNYRNCLRRALLSRRAMENDRGKQSMATIRESNNKTISSTTLGLARRCSKEMAFHNPGQSPILCSSPTQRIGTNISHDSKRENSDTNAIDCCVDLRTKRKRRRLSNLSDFSDSFLDHLSLTLTPNAPTDSFIGKEICFTKIENDDDMNEKVTAKQFCNNLISESKRPATVSSFQSAMERTEKSRQLVYNFLPS